MEELYDVAVIGGGPAGLTAALYLARARYRVLVLEQEQFGGQIAITDEVVNYPGVAAVDGKTLTETMRRQAEDFGAEFRLARATGLDVSGRIRTVRTDRGDVQCLGILLATGARPRAVGFRGEEEFKGRGVAYCATCDGEFFTGKDIFVVGGGYAAAEESVFLTKYARHVTVLVRKGDFSCAPSVADRAKNHEKITVLTNTVLEEVSGENGLTYVRYKNTATGEVTEVRCPAGETLGVFVFAGYAPASELVNGLTEVNEQGYIVTDADGKTGVEGLYAAGDVRVKSLRQVVTATGDGALAATALEKYVAQVQEQTGLRGRRPQRKSSQKDDGQGSVFDPEVREQLMTLFSRMNGTLVLKLYLDNGPLSAELDGLMTALSDMTDRLTVIREGLSGEPVPWVEVCRPEGGKTGLAFHGVPGGHEFTSFVLGLYNAAGPGQALDGELLNRIRALSRPVELKLLVTLSCSMCPELVVAAQRIAAENPQVTAHVYDIRHFEQLREKYRVMSVPCLVINDRQAIFGRKNLPQLLTLLEQTESE